MTAIDVRPLVAHEWEAAMSLTARAFLHEPFVRGLFGEDLVQRYSQVHRMYLSTAWDHEDPCLGAFVNGTLVGAIGVEPEGRCHHCRPEERTSVYAINAASAHRRRPPNHGWVGRVAVEPALHGVGIGSALVAEALRTLDVSGTPAVLLDAETHRSPFYSSRGFIAVDSFRGSVGNELVLMEAQLA